MLKSSLAWTLLIGAACAQEPSYQAVTNADATLRYAPSTTSGQSGIIPRGRPVTVEICFYEGAYCAVTSEAGKGYIAGDLLTIAGETTTVLAAEQAKWVQFRKDREWNITDEFERRNIIVWGDSMSNNTYMDELRSLLPARDVASESMPGETGEMIGVRMLADTRYTTRFKIIWDRHWPHETPEAYLQQIKPMVERARETGGFLIVSTVPQLKPGTDLDPGEDAADAAAINRALAATYPDDFVDVSPYLTEITTRVGDGLHLSKDGEEIVARILADAIKARSPDLLIE